MTSENGLLEKCSSQEVNAVRSVVSGPPSTELVAAPRLTSELSHLPEQENLLFLFSMTWWAQQTTGHCVLLLLYNLSHVGLLTSDPVERHQAGQMNKLPENTLALSSPGNSEAGATAVFSSPHSESPEPPPELTVGSENEEGQSWGRQCTSPKARCS